MAVSVASASGTANPIPGNTVELSIRLLALLERMTRHATPDDVHKLRTSVRRVEVRLGHCPAKVARALRSLRKKAGKVRDIDVHLGLLKSSLFAPPSGATSGVRVALRHVLKYQRQVHQDSLLRLVSQAAPLLQARLSKVVQRAAAPEPDAQAARRRTAQARQRFLQWGSIPEAGGPLHRLRIEAKKLRYSLEPFSAFADAAEMAQRLKQVQDAIGSWHDWATLLELAGRELGPYATEPAFAALEARTAREFNKARRTAERVRQWMATSSASVPRAHSSQSIMRKAG